MADVFLSYARDDRERVASLQASLAAHGFDVFWDTEIRPGIRWDEELQQRLEGAKCVLVAWSEASVRSHWVKDEAGYGRDRGILLPVTLDGTTPPLGFRQLQTLDLSKWRGDPADPVLERLLAQVERALGSESVPPHTPRERKRSRKRMLVLGAIATVLFLGFAAAALVPPVRDAITGLFSPATVPAREEEDPGVQSATALPRPGTRFKECDECPIMVVLPAGQSVVGAPPEAIRAGEAASDQGPQHRIVIADPFAVGESEITVREFRAFIEESGHAVESGCTVFEDGFMQDASASFDQPGYSPEDEMPAVCISFEDAEAYARWLTEKSGEPYRLLSEAEWEYAARAGSEATFAFGEDPANFCRYANIADESAGEFYPDWNVAPCSDGFAGVAPAGSLEANVFGLADMHGNVWEWVADCWHGSYELAPIDGRAWLEGGDCERRVVRGGAWDTSPRDARVSLRGKLEPDTHHAFYGFRVARD